MLNVSQLKTFLDVNQRCPDYELIGSQSGNDCSMNDKCECFKCQHVAQNAPVTLNTQRKREAPLNPTHGEQYLSDCIFFYQWQMDITNY